MALRRSSLSSALAMGLLLAPIAFADTDPPASAASALEASVADTEAGDPASTTTAAQVQPALDWTTRVKVRPQPGLSLNRGREADNTLRLVSRSDTGVAVAATVGLAVLSPFTGRSARSFTKKNLRGERIDSVPSPALSGLQDLLQDALADYFSAHPDALPESERTVHIFPEMWTLTYQELSGSNLTYELMHTSMLIISSSPGRPMVTIKCEEAPQTALLEQWQADDYAQVKAAGQHLAQQCAERFAAELPTTFPVAGAPQANGRIAPREAMYVFLFGGEQVQIAATNGEPPAQELANSNDSIEVLDTLLASVIPGTRVCAIAPDLPQDSALNGQLKTHVIDKGQALPGRWETLDGLNRRRDMAADAPIDMAAAMDFCRSLSIKEFIVY